MAKAILVIDIPEDYTGSVISVNLYGRNNKVIHEIHTNKLRPLPQNVKAGDERFWKLKDGCIAKEHIHYEFANGWNACLNEITGETE